MVKNQIGTAELFGAGTSGIENFVSIYKIDDFQTRRLGSTAVQNNE
jgi:hypothetical protein